MSENDSPEPGVEVSEEEQQAIAIEWFLAMWQEALKRGVTDEKMAIVSLSGVVNQLVTLYGEEGAALLVEQLPDRIKEGQFTSKSDAPTQ